MACKITNCYNQEGNFDTVGALSWLHEYRYVAVTAVVIYLSLVYTGRRWMEKRPRYDPVTSLTLWNVMLAVFSLFGLMNLLPNFVHVISNVGIQESMCKLTLLENPQIGMWFVLFVFSKIVEFGDTLFIVLRKSNLQFLHWYHHVTVLLYSWFALSGGMYSAGYWFATVNYSVHVVMYTYFALRSMGIYVPSNVAMLITVLQIVQMFIGLIVNFVLYKFHLNGRSDCFFDWNYFYATCGLYGSYALLFLHFFCNRYIFRKAKRN